jgi:arabinan endo-1,5-alpha-L-arabinosidase
MSPYMVQAQQKWTITPVAGAGGYPGSPYFKITIAGRIRALAATEAARSLHSPLSPADPSSCGG